VGIAQAILGDPQIVILDEPTVGLDPKQIVEIRSLIKELGQKHTVILSSHILSEVSEICDEIIIISAGKIVASDSAENLMGRFNSHVIIEITVKGDPDRAAEALAGLDEVLEIEIDDSLTGGMSKLFVKADSDIRAELADILVQNGIAYISMNVERANLEDIFLKLTDNGGEAFTAEEDAAYAGTEENEEEEGDE
ncbi:MAG: ABC transporter, partial [Clostridia bacterium]|nr:ABC transporter [Clostridia bacterium]